MKKIILLSLLSFSKLEYSQNVNIPDANFKTALLSNTVINNNADGEIQMSEAASYTGTINVSSKNISSLTGIEAFTAITGLNCSYNQLVTLNVSQNVSLSALYCGNNQLTSLSVSSNVALTILDCSENQLTSIDVSANASLILLGCNNNQLTTLNLSSNTSLTNLVCGFNQLNNLNLINNTALASVVCGNNHISALNLVSNTALVTLTCNNNQLTQLDLSTNAALKYLNCQQNQLVGLDVSGNASLKEIRCYNNQLVSLNVKNSNNVNLTAFYAYNNPGLSCIQVDDVLYMNAQWSGGKDAAAVYSENCSTGILETRNNVEFLFAYPNPASGIFFVNSGNRHGDFKIRVRDNLGYCLLEIVSRGGEAIHKIDLSDRKPGVYFLEVMMDGQNSVRKMVLY